MNIREARKALGLTMKAFSERYNIPLRTVENWEGGQRTPPPYVSSLLQDKIKNDLLIIEVAGDCADSLGVTCPKIEFGTEKSRDGNLTGLILDSNKNPKKLLVSDEYVHILDILFGVCHEIRHVYQALYMKEIFSSYIELEKLDTEAYNLQEAEIDANAYASLFIEKNFGVAPLFTGYSDKVKAAIKNRKRELMKEDF